MDRLITDTTCMVKYVKTIFCPYKMSTSFINVLSNVVIIFWSKNSQGIYFLFLDISVYLTFFWDDYSWLLLFASLFRLLHFIVNSQCVLVLPVAFRNILRIQNQTLYLIHEGRLSSLVFPCFGKVTCMS